VVRTPVQSSQGVGDQESLSVAEAAHWLHVYGSLVTYTRARGMAVEPFDFRLSHWREVYERVSAVRAGSEPQEWHSSPLRRWSDVLCGQVPAQREAPKAR
jgi:hypothetical protein